MQSRVKDRKLPTIKQCCIHNALQTQAVQINMGNGSFISFYFIPLFLCPGLWGVLASIADLIKACVPLPHSSLLLQVTLLKMLPLIRFLLKAVNRIKALVPRHTLLYFSLHSVSPFSIIFPTGVMNLVGFPSEVQVNRQPLVFKVENFFQKRME